MLDDAGGRTSRAEQYRRPRRSFFSPPNERDEACFGVTEHPLDTRLWAEPGKRVRVRQTAALACRFGHPNIMPNLTPSQYALKSMKIDSVVTFYPKSTHTFTGRPIILCLRYLLWSVTLIEKIVLCSQRTSQTMWAALGASVCTSYRPGRRPSRSGRESVSLGLRCNVW